MRLTRGGTLNNNYKDKIKEKLTYIKENKKEVFHNSLHNSIFVCIVLCILLNIFIETISRHSLAKCFEYFISSPMTFLFNCFIIFATLSIAFLAKRRFFVYTVISIVWMGLGITNGIILSTRTTPFTVSDLSLVEAGLSIITNYLSITQIVLIGVGVVAALVIFILIFIFAPKHKGGVDYRKSIVGILVVAMLMAGATNLAISQNWVSIYFGNLNYAYRDYGFPYCFVNTWLNTGISMPKDYSEASIVGIFTEDENKEISDETKEFRDGDITKTKTPNILMLQLESFFDPTLLKGVEFSKDPIPYFRELKENYSTGYLTVPSVGAGTANTEFESLTGMRVRFFGPGEYPYKSILTEKTCESICYDLKPLGYASHAIHNHRGVFYGRNDVFANLGFDTFTSIEYMNNVTKTPKNWAKDEVLTSQITDALDSTENQDFIYTISVQGHGQYPTEPLEEIYAAGAESEKITVSGIESLAEKVGMEYYLEQIHEMDKFIKDLTDELSKYDEDIILVMYGDHLPGINVEDTDLKNGSVYETEYVIWSNYKMKKEDKNLFSYQLSAEILDRAGIDNGVMTKYHQNHMDDKNYLSNLKALQYDMLYGEQYIYGSQGTPYERTKLKMGVNDIKIQEIIQIGEKYFIKGQNFTPFSKVSINGKILDTIYIHPGILGLLEKVNPEDVSEMKVSQVENKNKNILSTTE